MGAAAGAIGGAISGIAATPATAAGSAPGVSSAAAEGQMGVVSGPYADPSIAGATVPGQTAGMGGAPTATPAPPVAPPQSAFGKFFGSKVGAETIKGGLGTLKGLLLDDEAEKAQRTSDIAVEKQAKIQAQNRPGATGWDDFKIKSAWDEKWVPLITGYTAPLKKGILQPEVTT